MLDIKFVRENIDAIRKACELKRIAVDIDQLLKLDGERREIMQKMENLQAELNKSSKEVPSLTGDAKESALADLKKMSDAISNYKHSLQNSEDRYQALMLQLPGVPLDRVPVGKDDTENVEIRTWGEPRQFDFAIKDHVELGKNLDIIDIPRGVKLSGARFYVLKNEGALLEMAVLKYTLDQLVLKGFSPFIVPHLVKYEAMMGTSYFPGGEEQAYTMEKDGLYLIGTSEVSVTSYHADEVLKEEELPKKYCGISPCYRREAGTYGKDTHGLYRIHQFQKVEQVIICKNDPDESAKMHQMILQNAEDILQALDLAYRVVDVCTGDMGQGQIYKNDIETWMPSRQAYGETHSCSTFYDFQSRRLNMRYKDSTGKNQYCHTLNNTCIASPRVLIPILENYQNADGSVTIPEVLRPYMMGKERIEVK